MTLAAATQGQGYETTSSQVVADIIGCSPEQVQVRAMEIGTHVPLGEYANPVAARKNVKGLLPGPQTMVLWNVEKQ